MFESLGDNISCPGLDIQRSALDIKAGRVLWYNMVWNQVVCELFWTRFLKVRGFGLVARQTFGVLGWSVWLCLVYLG